MSGRTGAGAFHPAEPTRPCILLHSSNLEAIEPIVRAIAAELLGTQKNPFQHPDCFTLRPSGKARMIKIGSESERTQGEWPQNPCAAS